VLEDANAVDNVDGLGKSEGLRIGGNVGKVRGEVVFFEKRKGLVRVGVTEKGDLLMAKLLVGRVMELAGEFVDLDDVAGAGGEEV